MPLVEFDTGETTLSFAAHELGDSNFPGGHVHAHSSTQPLGMEIALVTSDVAAAHSTAIVTVRGSWQHRARNRGAR
jgi:hypothetical protein